MDRVRGAANELRADGLRVLTDRRSGAARLLLVVAALGLLLVVADAVTAPGSALWDTDLDRSVIELLGYLLALLAAVLLWRAAPRYAPAAVLRAWAVVLVVVVADDAGRLHEGGGHLLEDVALPRPPGLRPQDAGELLTWALLGAACLLLLVLAWRRSGPAGRRAGQLLLLPAALLVAAAVGLDLVDQLLNAAQAPRAVLSAAVAVEAAAELVALACFPAVALHLRSAGRA